MHQHLDLVNDDGTVVVVDQQVGIHVDIQAVVGAVVVGGGGGAVCCVILPLQLTNQQQAWTLWLKKLSLQVLCFNVHMESCCMIPLYKHSLNRFLVLRALGLKSFDHFKIKFSFLNIFQKFLQKCSPINLFTLF